MTAGIATHPTACFPRAMDSTGLRWEHRVVPKPQRVARVKNGFDPKICTRCGLPFEWRKKWARDWESVQYCSQRCRDGR
jgi:hypothetical protein